MKPPVILNCPPGTAKVGTVCHRLHDATPCIYNVPSAPASGCVFELILPPFVRCAPGNRSEPAACALMIEPMTPVDKLIVNDCMGSDLMIVFAVLFSLVCN